jgi:hypothetical protein
VEIDLELAGISPETAIFVPSGFSMINFVDIVFYLHGWRIDHDPPSSIGEYLLRRYGRLRESLNASGRNVALVAPTLGNHSEAGRLLNRGGLDHVISLALATLRDQSGDLGREITLRNLVLAAHSGGGSPMRVIAGGADDALANLRECWGLDSAYNNSDQTFWPTWARRNPADSCYLYYREAENPPTVKHNVEVISEAGVPNIIVKAAATEEHMIVPITHFAERLRGARCLEDKDGFAPMNVVAGR